jgi:HlyD family secretion protein
MDVRSPITGRVLRVLAESEQVVLAGTPLIELGDPADLEVVVELLSRDAVGIAPRAKASIEGWGGAALAAEVVRIDPAAKTKVSALGIEEQRVTTVLRLSEAPDVRARLGHDFRVEVRIETQKVENAIAVPTGALFRKGADWAVFRDQDRVARLAVVELGARNADVAEVRSGLAEGDTVILHPNDEVADGVAIAH